MQLVYTLPSRPMTAVEHLTELITYQENVKRQAEIDNRFFQRRITKASNGKEEQEAMQNAANCQTAIVRSDDILAYLREVLEEEKGKASV
jgi:hypothetical protein